MDAQVREQLTLLGEMADSDPDSEIPLYVRESIIQVVESLLSEEASNEQVKATLTGGLRAIADAGVVNDEDRIVSIMHGLAKD